jgi:Nucleotidyltransferase
MAGDSHSTSEFEGECVSVALAKRTLTYEQVLRLGQVVDSPLQVPGRGNYPHLDMTVRKLILAVRRRLERDGMPVEDVRINGSAASFIVIGGNDLDQV